MFKITQITQLQIFVMVWQGKVLWCQGTRNKRKERRKERDWIH